MKGEQGGKDHEMAMLPPAVCMHGRYKEGSAGARGIVGTESATIALADGKVEQLKDVVLGCSSSHDGQSFRLADGVLSLEKANISFASRAAACFLGSFFYCLNFVLVQ